MYASLKINRISASLFYRQNVINNNKSAEIYIRTISSAEIATALRPFYFVVHPDLFGRYPKQRSVNEESLKHLSAYLEATQKYTNPITISTPKSLEFYVRNQSVQQHQDNLKLIRITIERKVDTKTIIRNILLKCNLSTDYLDQVQNARPTSIKTGNRNTKNNLQNSNQTETFHGFSDEYEIHDQIKREMSEKTLKQWLMKNVDIAHSRSDALNIVRADVKRLEKILIELLHLKDIQYDCGWNFEHYRGCLKSLERLAKMHEKDMKQLHGRILVFAPCSGVSLEGHIMLFTGDVQHNWLDFIRNISKQDDYLLRIPSYESALSQVLRDIRIARRKFMPKAQVVNYAAQLRKVTTAMLDYLTYHKYPISWPDSLKNLELVVESESGPLMVSPTGQLITPSTCPGVILVDFLTNHMNEAEQKMLQYKTNKHIERKLHEQCLIQLQLKSLTKDDSIDPQKMIECLEKLLSSNKKIEFKSIILHITHYYSVLSDGTVCIPWNWILE